MVSYTSQKLILDCLLNADLHCHSTHSDGTLAPEVLAQRAKDQGVELWALTDHDEVSGIAAAAAAAHDLGLPFLAGSEISINYAGGTVHIVGLGLDVHNGTLVQGLRQTRLGRVTRAQEMGKGLAAVGIDAAFEGAVKYVDNPENISRTHFARFLVEKGVCRDNNEVFKKYLVEGKPGYVPSKWMSLQECVHLICEAKGMAIIAHPGRYKHLNKIKEHALFTEFKALGGLGVEVITGSHSSEDMVYYTQMAKDFGLFASRGSDFHSPSESRIDLGALPLLSQTLDPVWCHLQEQILY